MLSRPDLTGSGTASFGCVVARGDGWKAPGTVRASQLYQSKKVRSRAIDVQRIVNDVTHRQRYTYTLGSSV